MIRHCGILGKKTSMARAWALVRKETCQMLRDKSTLTLGIFLPLLLLFLFGFGLSLDVDEVPVVIVRENSSPVTRDLYISLKLSRYFDPAMVYSWKEATELLRSGKTDAIIRRSMKDSHDGIEKIQIIVNGRDSNTARIMQRYLTGGITRWAAVRESGTGFLSGRSGGEKMSLAQSEEYARYERDSGVFGFGGAGYEASRQGMGNVQSAGSTGNAGRAVAETRIWYNSALESRYFLVPGVTALIMTLIGTLLTSLVIAREWERGTYEALVATPVRRHEILSGKTIPYFVLGMIGLLLCLAASRLVFGVPMRGSLWLIIAGSAVYLLVSLGIGLFVSATVKNQFLASQIVLIFSFLPTLMLSGFIFDLKSAPLAAYYFAHIFPATWYVDLLQTLFLVGNVPGIVIPDVLVLSAFALALLGLASAKIQKTVG